MRFSITHWNSTTIYEALKVYKGRLTSVKPARLEGRLLKIDREQSNLERLKVQTLRQAKILERRDLQRMIVGAPDAFFEEMQESLVLVGEEVEPSSYVGDRIDLLAIDRHGASVII